MRSGTLRQEEMSYELFQEIANDLCVPIDPNLTATVRLELYKSKMVYLRNLFDQAFLECNGRNPSRFTSEDLNRLRQSVEVTHEFLRQTTLEIVQNSLQEVLEREERLPCQT